MRESSAKLRRSRSRCGSCCTAGEPNTTGGQLQSGPASPGCSAKKPIYKKWWFWVIIAVVVICIVANLGGNGDKTESGSSDTSQTGSTNEGNDSSKADTSTKTDASTADSAKVTIADFSTMDQAAIQSWADTNKVTCNFSEDYSDSVEKGGVISQSKNAGETVKEGTTIKVVISLGKKISTEYTNALMKAELYSETMNMSKKAIYDQLTSEYGEQFTEEETQYAIDHLDD